MKKTKPMRRLAPAFLAVAVLGWLAGCAEQPKYADPVESAKADENRIKAIESNPNLTPAQKEWQINRIKGEMKPPKK